LAAFMLLPGGELDSSVVTSLWVNSKPPVLTVISVSTSFIPPPTPDSRVIFSNLFVPVNSITPAPLVLNDTPEVLVLTASFM